MAEKPSADTRPLSDDAPASRPAPGAQDFPIVARSHYEIGEEFARGGSGRLLRARDKRLDRVVAIKEPRERSSHVERRFRREALLTARLQHPSIVPVHEIGRWPTGEPFYAMKLISGRSLGDVVAETKTLAQRVALVPNVLAVADAVAYAHSERVIHRDLKPANVMVGAFGETQVIDWGLAKAIGDLDEAGEGTSGERALDRHDTGVIGTPSSMAPEQAAGLPLDERTDVYGVGAILYHVLAGGPPYLGDDATAILDRLVREPPPPIAERSPGVPRELVAIVERAMAREPFDRYPSALELASDLRRFLAGQLVAAHDYSWWQLSARFVRRNRRVLTVLSLSLAALLAFADYSVRRILVERTIAVKARGQAETQRSRLLLSQAKLWLDRDPTVAVAWLKEYAATRDPDRTAISTLAADARARGVASQRVRERRKSTLAPDGVTLAGQLKDALVVWTTTNAKPRTLGPSKAEVSALQFSEDSKTLFVAEGKLVEAVGLDGARRELFHADEEIRQLVPAGPRILAAGRHGTLWVIDPATPDVPPRALRGNPDGVWTHVASRDGSEVLSSSRDRSIPKQIRLWHLPGGTSESIEGHPFYPAISADGAQLAWGEDDASVHVYDVARKTTRVLRGHTNSIRRVVFSSDGTRVASASADRTVRLWDLATGSSRVLQGYPDWAMFVLFSPDDRLLATTCLDRTVRVWDLATGDSDILVGYTNGQETVRFSPDSRTLVTADNQGEVRVWKTEPASDRTLAHDEQYAQLGFLPDGRLVGADTTQLDVWDTTTGASTTDAEPGGVNVMGISADGRTLVQGTTEGSLRVRDLASGAGRASKSYLGHDGTIQDLAITRDGSRAVTGGVDRTVRLWNTRTGEQHVIGKHGAAVWHVAFSPDEAWIVSAGDDPNLRVWDLAHPDGSKDRELAGHTGLVYDLGFSPDGRWLASVGTDTTVRLWPTAGGQPRVLEGHSGLVQKIAFSPDSRKLATASDDRTVRLWDLATGEARVFEHGAAVTVVRFVADGQSIVSGTTDGVVRVWDLTGGVRSILRGRAAEVIDLTVSKDARWIAISGNDGAVRLWNGITNAPRAAVTPEDLAQLTSVVIAGDEAISP